MSTTPSSFSEKYRVSNSFRKPGFIGDSKPHGFEYDNGDFPSLEKSKGSATPMGGEMYRNVLVKNTVWVPDAASTPLKPSPSTIPVIKKKTTVHPIIKVQALNGGYARTSRRLSSDNDRYEDDRDDEDYYEGPRDLYVSER